MNQNTLYQKLTALSKHAAIYTSISYVLSWDLETYMPKEAISLRIEQNETLASFIHQQKTNAEYRKALSSLIDIETGDILISDLDEKQKAALREWRRDYVLASKLPTTFVQEFAKVTSAAIPAWQTAKSQNDFNFFIPHLEKIIFLNQKKAEILGYKDHPYDALIDSFEPEMTTAKLATLFEKLSPPLTDLLRKIQKKNPPETAFLHTFFPPKEQIAFSKQLLKDMGFKEEFSRLDESSHPMCIPIHPKDMRMTTRISPHNMLSNILSCAHEGGHGLYHIHLPKEFFGTPLCEAASLAIDESQSRIWETFLARSFPFWKYYFPKLQKIFPNQLSNISLEQFYKAIHFIGPSMIRVDSDEISYNLHIMLRFELEKKLMEGTLKPKEVPEAWNAAMQKYLHTSPKTFAEGCLQDIHWSMGSIGYFPTYTLGNVYAGQFFETFTLQHPNWKEEVSKGNFRIFIEWQKETIHQFGRQFLPHDLCKKVTGKPLNETAYIDYLNKKYTDLYHL